MPSVVVWWSGTCVDPDAQEELIEYMTALSHECRARFEGPALKRPAFLEKIVEVESAAVPGRPAAIVYDGPIDGNILVDGDLAADRSLARHEATRLGTRWIPAGGDASEDSGFFQLGAAHLRGIDFRLFDPRGIYPCEDRMSFVFLRCQEIPAIDGRIALISDRVGAQIYEHQAIKSADWFAMTPSLHLRYYLEEWIDHLFAWVKYFFIPDFAYWRYENLPGYETASMLYARVEASDGRELAKRRVLEQLVEWFNKDADDWTARMATW
jgi:hypothetical protein